MAINLPVARVYVVIGFPCRRVFTVTVVSVRFVASTMLDLSLGWGVCPSRLQHI